MSKRKSNQSSAEAGLKGQSELERRHREVEKLRLSRMPPGKVTSWGSLQSRDRLTIAEILQILLDRSQNNEVASRSYDNIQVLLDQVYQGLDGGTLNADLNGIYYWADTQGILLDPPPGGLKTKKSGRRTEKRDAALQPAANRIADQWLREGNWPFTEKQVAEEVKKIPEFSKMSVPRIMKLINADWRR